MQQVLIIGAGAAGLAAARELSKHCAVLVLEAQAQVGGRIHSAFLPSFGRVVETGPEFIHGHLPITLQMLMQAGIDYKAVEGAFYRKKNGRWNEQDEMIEGWDTVLDTMRQVPESMTLHTFLETYYGGEQQAGLRHRIRAFAEGFDVADITRVSVRALYKEWSHEEAQNFRIPAGYSSLVSFLQQECEQQGVRILTGHAVQAVEWQKDKVTVTTANGQSFEAGKLLVTVPLHLLQQPLQQGGIHFSPSLDNYTKAAADIGMGGVLKLALLFDDPFWQPDAGFILGDGEFPTWWTQLPDTAPLLTGWIGGPRTQAFTTRSDKQVIDKALQSLAALYELPMASLKSRLQGSAVFRWPHAYSFSMPGTPVARKLLNKPIMHTIFFAGEALYEGESQGTVEAALESGREAAERIMIR